jgi:hypothetical protein
MKSKRLRMTIDVTKKEEIEKPSRKPNKETLKAIKELEKGGGYPFESLECFWSQMKINPNVQ